MSQKTNKKRVGENEARAFCSSIRVSPRKLNLLAQMIRGMHVSKALSALQFSQKRVAVEVQKALLSAIANAENNHNLDVDNLIVNQAIVGRDFVLKRFLPCAKGRGARLEKPFSNITIVVREVEVA
jgi:large subunit ribosomal protein L22